MVLFAVTALPVSTWCFTSNKNIEAAFSAVVAQKENYQKQIHQVTGYGKEAVPFLLQKLKDTSVVYSIVHPGYHDDLGMPKVGWTDSFCARDITKGMLGEIYTKSSPGDPNAKLAEQAVDEFIQQELTPFTSNRPDLFNDPDKLSTAIPNYISEQYCLNSAKFEKPGVPSVFMLHDPCWY
jgi:hypothetical protein